MEKEKNQNEESTKKHGKIQEVETSGEMFDEALSEENGARMFDEYQLNTRFVEVMRKEPLSGIVTKVPGWRGQEDVVLRTQILRHTIDVRLNPSDKEYLTFKGVGHKVPAELNKFIGNKSGKPYWGIRFNLGNGDQINYALTYSNMRVLVDLKIFHKKFAESLLS